MLNYLRGKIIQKNPTNITIDVNGIGYFLNITLNSFERLPDINTEVKIFTILIPREDAILLYGFAEESEKQMFEQLISINGIGPKVAQSILSGIKPNELKEFIAQGNILALTNIPGVGKKTAERMIVELRDKLAKIPSAIEMTSTSTEDIRIQAFQALVTLGYQRQTAEKAIRSAINELKSDEMNLENLIKKSLQSLNK